MRCQGNAINGERKCKNSTWNANSLYCKWHDPKIIKCKGIAKNSGKRCGLHENLNSTGYCRYHETQDPQYSKKKSKERIQAYPSRCKGFAATTNQQCRIDWDLDEYGYCKYHKNQRNGLYGNQKLIRTEDEEVRLRYQWEEDVDDSDNVVSRTLQSVGSTLADLSPRKTSKKKLEMKYTDCNGNPTDHKSPILHQHRHSRRILQG